MSGEHALRERAELLDKLRDIVQAMKNMAFAELQRVNHDLPALAEARDALQQAIARVPPAGPARRTGAAAATWLVIGAERGFCGAFNTHLAAQLVQIRQACPSATVLVASQRLLDLIGRENDPHTTLLAVPGCSAVEDSHDVLQAWLTALLPWLADPQGELWLLHTSGSGPQRRRLWPPDPAAGAGPAAAPPDDQRVLHHLPWPTLREALERQALRLLLQAALHESLAQENHQRLTQMQRAQDHLDELGRALRRKRSALRQAEITNELETLISAQPRRAAHTDKVLP